MKREEELTVSVKPLEWERAWDEDGSDWLEAGTPFRTYAITFTPHHKLPYVLKPFGLNLDSNYATMDDAKAAAQSHFDAAISSCLVLTPKHDGATHRHKKRGSTYALIGIGKMQAEDWCEWAGDGSPSTSVDMAEVAIYRSVDDGSLWVRPRDEFEDGRFETLRAALNAKPEQTEHVDTDVLENSASLNTSQTDGDGE